MGRNRFDRLFRSAQVSILAAHPRPLSPSVAHSRILEFIELAMMKISSYGMREGVSDCVWSRFGASEGNNV